MKLPEDRRESAVRLVEVVLDMMAALSTEEEPNLIAVLEMADEANRMIEVVYPPSEAREKAMMLMSTRFQDQPQFMAQLIAAMTTADALKEASRPRE